MHDLDRPLWCRGPLPTLDFATIPTALLRFLNSHLQRLIARRQRLGWRLGILLLLAVVAAIFFAYGYVDLISYNHYCREERGDDLIFVWREDLQIVAFVYAVLALPCLMVRRSLSLRAYTVLSAALLVISLCGLVSAAAPPLECFSSGGSRPSRDFDVLGPLAVGLAAINFYGILAWDLVVSVWRWVTAARRSASPDRA